LAFTTNVTKAVAQTEILKEKLIPTVPLKTRGTSSWKKLVFSD
jgi:methylenetetrahydrofolate reductase (NADPH)